MVNARTHTETHIQLSFDLALPHAFSLSLFYMMVQVYALCSPNFRPNCDTISSGFFRTPAVPMLPFTAINKQVKFNLQRHTEITLFETVINTFPTFFHCGVNYTFWFTGTKWDNLCARVGLLPENRGLSNKCSATFTLSSNQLASQRVEWSKNIVTLPLYWFQKKNHIYFRCLLPEGKITSLVTSAFSIQSWVFSI